MERFNHADSEADATQGATEEGKDGTSCCPTCLHTGRCPRPLQDFSVFLHGQQVPGPLDVLKKSWEPDKRSSESVISYVLTVQEKFAKMSALVGENLEKVDTSSDHT